MGKVLFLVQTLDSADMWLQDAGVTTEDQGMTDLFEQDLKAAASAATKAATSLYDVTVAMREGKPTHRLALIAHTATGNAINLLARVRPELHEFWRAGK